MIVFLAVLGCTAAMATTVPFNDSSLYHIDWSKVRSEDLYLDPATKEVFSGPGGRIIGGTEAPRNSIPYQVGIITDKSGFCGGSLISANAVLSAAHCFIGSLSATVILGAHNIQQTEPAQVRVTTSRIINHPDYDPEAFPNDVAVLILAQSVPINANVRIINLAPATSGEFSGSKSLLSGWGRTSDNATAISPVLRQVNLNIIHNLVCSLFYEVLNETNICTSGQGVVGGCNGDSGGPLVVDGVQVGIVSFGSRLCEASQPTAYARVSSFRSWIQQVAGV